MSQVTLYGNVADTVKKHSALLNDISDRLNTLAARYFTNQVLGNDAAGTAGKTGVSLDVDDGGAQDVEFNNGIFYQIDGQTYYKAADAAIDISAECAGAGDTVTTSKAGAFWLFVDKAGNVDGDTAEGAAQAHASAVIALAQYSIAANTLPPVGDVAVGVISVVEGGSGTFTWGTGSITDETELYYSFQGLPSIESAIASFAAHSTATQIAYGAAVIVLGTGVRVTLTGKDGVSFAGTDSVAKGAVGAFGLYALADDTECLITLTAAATSLQNAKDFVRDLAPNPLMPLLGVVYVEATRAAFVAGTSVLTSAAYTVSYVTHGPGANQVELGRGISGEFTALDHLVYAVTGRP
jgi:hypothetical protein